MKIKISLSLSILSLIFVAFISDADPFAELLKKLDVYTSQYPQEKIHLHLDKPYYVINDDIWIKAYVLNTKTKQPSTISNILYIDLIDEKDSIKKQLKLPILYGVSWGDFNLPDSLPEGNYRIRAYTQYMRNFDADFFFDKTIKIAKGGTNKVFANTNYQIKTEGAIDKIYATIHFENKAGIAYAQSKLSYEIDFDNVKRLKGKTETDIQGNAVITWENKPELKNKIGRIIVTLQLGSGEKVTKSIPLTPISNTVDVQFMPEGGSLVEGLPQKIAVKAADVRGHGQDVSGIIIDEAGNEITNFSTTYLGMGNFIFNPQNGKSYTANIKFKDGTNTSIKLPLAEKIGYNLSVNHTGSNELLCKIMASENLIKGEELKIVVQQAGNIYYASKVKMDNRSIKVSMPKNRLPIGIVQFTLFSASNQPIAERLIFIKNSNELIEIALDTSSVSSKTKGKAAFRLKVVAEQNPIKGSFSVAVTNSSKILSDEDNESNILTTLLLTSDLAGYIEKPNHYFLNNDLKTTVELDNLMLTQGWRRFKWKEVMMENWPRLTYQPEQSLKISGTVTKAGKPLVGGNVMLIPTAGSVALPSTVITNTEGKFVFANLNFGDTAKFIVQARSKTGQKLVSIHLDSLFNQLVTKNKNRADIDINLNKTLMSYIKQSDGYFNEMKRLGLVKPSIKLNEVTIRAKKQLLEKSSNLNGPGNADYVLTTKDISTCVTLQMCLISKLPGIFLNDLGTMYIVLDGKQIGVDELESISPSIIASIEFLKPFRGKNIIYGGVGAGGVIIITTKMGNETDLFNQHTSGVIISRLSGFSFTRDFYSPKYQTFDNVNKETDLRTTIYWNPQILTDEKGEAKFEYYNANEPGTYRMVIEGIDRDGHMARKVFIYNVKEEIEGK